MEFLEGSRGIYRPIRVLFDTPIYDRALQLCWHINSYKSQIALVLELLKLQQKKLIPSQVTSEDMINLILEKSKSTIRERLWEFELEGFDEEEAKPLLMLVWEVNVSNKMRDVEFEARLLLNTPEAVPPTFLHPKVLNMAKEFAEILQEKLREAPSSKLRSPREVVMEVVSRVLQGLWVLSPRLVLNNRSLKLSKLSIGVTKAVLDEVSKGLTTRGQQVTFSRSLRDDMVLSVLTEIRQTYPHDILVKRIKSFAPVLLCKIVDVSVQQICGMFQPQVSAHLTPTNKPPGTTPEQEDFSLALSKEKPTPSSETNSTVVSPAHLTHPAEPASITKVQTRQDDSKHLHLKEEPKSTGAPDSAVTVAPATSPAEPASITNSQTREDDSEKVQLEKETETTGTPGSAVLVAPPTLLTEPACITNTQAREDDSEVEPESTRAPGSAVLVPSSTFPAEPLSTATVYSREDEMKKPCLEKSPEPATEPDSPQIREKENENPNLVKGSPTTLAEPRYITEVQDEDVEIKMPTLTKEPTPEQDLTVYPDVSTPSVEPRCISDVHTKKVKTINNNPYKDPELTRASDSAAASSLTLLTPPEVTTAMQGGLTGNMFETLSAETTSATVSPPPSPPTLPTDSQCITDVQNREIKNESISVKEDPKPTRAPDSVVIVAPPTSLRSHLEPAVTVENVFEVKINRKNRTAAFFHRLFTKLCCCFAENSTE